MRRKTGESKERKPLGEEARVGDPRTELHRERGRALRIKGGIGSKERDMKPGRVGYPTRISAGKGLVGAQHRLQQKWEKGGGKPSRFSGLELLHAVNL